jgi:L-fuconolactonase
MIIEWNAHMFSADTARFPFHPEAVYTPGAKTLEADPLAIYLERMAQEGIDRAVLVHPEPYGDDHRLVLDCLERERDRFKGTSLFYPKDPQAPTKLAALVLQEPKIVSTRFHAHRGKESYLDTFADAGVRALWEKALDLNLVVELHIGPDYGFQVVELMRHYPQTRVVIDHLAEPYWGDAVEFSHVLAMADFDQVYMKLSGLNHFATDAPYYPSAKPFTRRVIEAFGPQRVIWGSGSPSIVDVHMDGYSAAERDLVKGGNLARLLDWS